MTEISGPRQELAALASELRARASAMEEMELVFMTPGGKRARDGHRAGPAGREEIVAARHASGDAPGAESPDPTGSRESRLAALAEIVSGCRKCPLGSQRLRAVFGVGSPEARVLFVGEGPGFQEDHQGEPFIGRAGQLLDKILESIGLSRRSVYIANIVKCHPMVDPGDPEARGNDRPPAPEEIAACRAFLDQQISIISPRVIVTLGSVATKVLLGEDVPITKARGHWREYRAATPLSLPAGTARLPSREYRAATPSSLPADAARPPSRAYRMSEDAKPIKLLPTFHPAALLRNPVLKRDVWADMKNLKKELES